MKRCIYTKTCPRRVRHLGKWCNYHFRLTRLDREDFAGPMLVTPFGRVES